MNHYVIAVKHRAIETPIEGNRVILGPPGIFFMFETAGSEEEAIKKMDDLDLDVWSVWDAASPIGMVVLEVKSRIIHLDDMSISASVRDNKELSSQMLLIKDAYQAVLDYIITLPGNKRIKEEDK